MSESLCANCGTTRLGPFCHTCGQHPAQTRVSLWHWLREFGEEQFSISAKLPRTFSFLITKPGFLTAEWNEGRQTSYIPPVRLYVLAFFLLLTVMFTVTGTLWGEVLMLPREGIPGDTLRLAQALLREEVRRFLTLLMIALVPVLALLLKVVLVRRSFYLVQHLVFSLHLHTVALLCVTTVWLLTTINGELAFVAIVLLLAWLIVYMLRALRRAYGGPDTVLAVQQFAILFGYGLALTGAVLLLTPRLEREGVLANELVWTEAIEISYRKRANESFAAVMNELQRRPAHQFRGQIFSAIENQILATKGFDPHLNYHRAELYLALGDTFSASRLARRASFGSAPERVVFLSVLARMHEQYGRNAEAVELYRTLRPTGVQPPLPDAWRAHQPAVDWVNARARYRVRNDSGAVRPR